MFLETNIPETTQSLAGLRVGFGDQTLDSLIVNDRANQLQAIPALGVIGNRCGHVPREPRFYHRPENHKRRPSVLEGAILALESAYHVPKRFLKSFVGLNPKNRRKRSERREAASSVAQVLLHYLELSTLRVGFYDGSGGFVPLDLTYIAKKAGITFTRAKRAISDLVKAGYIKVARQFDKKDDGTFRGLPSIREISVQFFLDLGVDIERLFFTREWKRKKQEKSFAKQANKKLKGVLKAALSFGRQGLSSISKRRNDHRVNQDIDKTKNLIGRALELHKLNPERSVTDYFKELQQLE